MKTFNKEDLITWANREKAVIGNEYYFADCLDAIKRHIEKGNTGKLKSIADSSIVCTFEDNILCHYSCILPVDAVKEIKLEKKYRACENIKELYELVMNELSPLNLETDNDFAYELIDRTIHFRSKNTLTEYYSSITSISIKDNADIRILFRGKSYLSFEQIFKNYEIEINGKWQPFGVLEY